MIVYGIMITNFINFFSKVSYPDVIQIQRVMKTTVIISTAVGGLYGLQNGIFQKKFIKDNILYHLLGTLYCGMEGCSAGFCIGMFWPITVPMILVRTFERGRFDSSILYDMNSLSLEGKQ